MERGVKSLSAKLDWLTSTRTSSKPQKVLLTFSQEQCPWREKSQQKASSTRYPSDSSCKTCQPKAGLCGGS
jgi:hypothetical protein